MRVFSVLMMVLFAGLFSGCSNHREEDLVLVEFAARLEEDYHKIHPIRSTPGAVVPTEAPAPVDVDGSTREKPIESGGHH